MAFGRPREYDREAIMAALIEWAKLPNSLNINQFCAQYPTMLSAKKLCELAKDDEDFLEAYNYVKCHLGARREEAINKGTLHVKAYDLNATAYDYILKADRMETKTFEHELAKLQEQEKVSPETMEAFKAFMQQMSTFGSKDGNKKND